MAPPPEKPTPKKKAKPKRETKAERLQRERREAYARGAATPAPAAPDDTGAKQGPEHLKPTQWQPGQSGNPKGRPRGARSKLGEAFVEDLLGAWEKHGKVAIDLAMSESPLGFVRVVAGVIPQEIEHRFKDLEDMSDDDLDAAIARGVAALGLGGAGILGAAAAGKAAATGEE